MNKTLQNISGFFKIEKLKNDKQLVVFLVCLLIASILWFLNALSKDYSTVVSYPVKYVNPPKNQFLANKPPDKLDLKVDAHGFTLLRHKLSLSFSPIVLNLTNITKDLNSNSGAYSVNSRTLISRISSQVSNEITITEVQPDVLQFEFDSLQTKTVPVKLNIATEFSPQFNLKVPVYAVPAEVKVTGPSNIIDSIQFIYSKPKTYTKIGNNIEKTVELILPEKTTVSPQKVILKIEVEKFTEKELKIPITIRNKPENTTVKLFPSEVKILISVGLSEFDKIKPTDFEASVDFNTIEDGMQDIAVTIDKKPVSNQVIRYNPERVEFLVETN
ncbi:MAG: hypothetical protein R2757_05500 [Draconibacterium sp.]|jgi:YbbR domain-containing protein